MPKTRIGWKAGPEQFSPQELLECAVVAEDAGFETIEVSDHFHPWSEVGQACFTWTWLGAAAARTRSIRMGPGVTCPILRYHPSVIAQAAATVGVLAPGRAYLAVGTGEALNDYAATGEWPSYTERQARLEEAIDLIRQLWSGDEVTFEGQYYRTQSAKLSHATRPADSALRLVHRAAERVVRGECRRWADHRRRARARGLQAAYRAVRGGRARGGERSADDAARHRAKPRIRRATRGRGRGDPKPPQVLGGCVLYQHSTTRRSTRRRWPRRTGGGRPRYTAQEGVHLGGPEQHARFIQQHIDLGFTEIYVHSAAQDQRGFLRRFGQDVLPRVREGAARGGVKNVTRSLRLSGKGQWGNGMRDTGQRDTGIRPRVAGLLRL